MAHSLQRHFSCPVELALEVVGGKWKTVVLARLKERPHHYGELRELIPGLSDKMLTQRLKDLEELGLVIRHKRGPRGASAVYELAPRAESLRPALQGLHDWGALIADQVGAIIDSSQDTHERRRPRSRYGR
jgi:DNA-binding HxlR family transcriptional regulator